MSHSANLLPKLIPQDEFENLRAFNQSTNHFSLLIKQRDCVENLVRNTFNLIYLHPDGVYRSETENKIHETPLLKFWRCLAPQERVSRTSDVGRAWLDATCGFEHFGVLYDPNQGRREMLTGVDNIIALMTAMTTENAQQNWNVSDDFVDQQCADSVPNVNMSANTTITTNAGHCTASMLGVECTPKQRADNLIALCKKLSGDAMTVQWARNDNLSNSGTDVVLSLRFRQGDRKCVEKVKWLISSDHVCIRHGNELAH